MPEHADDSSDEALRAADFVLVAELDPALALAAVQMLRREGVDAYVRTRSAAAGSLFVARPAEAEARRLLDERLSGMREQLGAGETPEATPSGLEPASDTVYENTVYEEAVDEQVVDEEVWAELVAAFQGPSADVSDRRLLHSEAVGEARTLDPGGAEHRQPADLDDVLPDEHYEPELPPPLPKIGWLLGCAWAAVLGTPILFLIALWVHVDVTGWLGAIGVACFVGGFLVLVSRLGDGPDDWDDGAVV